MLGKLRCYRLNISGLATFLTYFSELEPLLNQCYQLSQYLKYKKQGLCIFRMKDLMLVNPLLNIKV